MEKSQVTGIERLTRQGVEDLSGYGCMEKSQVTGIERFCKNLHAFTL